MKPSHFIGFDVHCSFTEMAVVTATGRLSKRQRCPTTIPELAAALESVPRPRCVALEEGPLADWLWRNLARHADGFTVSDPRRNRLIAKDSDKDDPIDAEKLAQLLRGGYLKAVHHPESLERSVFKHLVLVYHDRVRQRVREANRIMGYLRRYGVFVREKAFQEEAQREQLLARLPSHRLIASNLRLLWESYDLAAEQVRQMRRRLVEAAQGEEAIRRFVAVPGLAWVRAATWWAYVDTPWRFRSKSALCKYAGIGLERRHSGQGPVHLGVVQQANRVLKGVLLGAAKRAIALDDNPYAAQYQRWLREGIAPANARRNVARSLAATLWGMWKNGSVYHPEWVGVAAAAVTAPEGSSAADGCSQAYARSSRQCNGPRPTGVPVR
jgi:transposase